MKIINDTVSTRSEIRAGEEMTFRTNFLNSVVDHLETETNRPQMIAKDLLQKYLYPQVHKDLMEQKLKSEGGKI